MRPIGRWLVPLFLLLTGALLIWDSSLLYADGTSNLNLQNSAACDQFNSSAPHNCATLVSNPEMELALSTGFLGTMTLGAGVGMAAVRWFRTSGASRSL